MTSGTNRIFSTLAIIIGIAAVPMAGAAADDTPRYSPEFEKCETHSGVTVEIRECTRKELEFQNKRLNQAYSVLMKTADDTVKTKMKAAQREWMKYRDAECELEGVVAGGTLEALVIDSCHLTFTERRASELEKLNRQLDSDP
jgi:uncharacterized protein YecT (DUF1311 family)